MLAGRESDVQRGFYDTGIFPPSPEMMERWCYWDKEYVHDAAKLIAAQMLGSADDERH